LGDREREEGVLPLASERSRKIAPIWMWIYAGIVASLMMLLPVDSHSKLSILFIALVALVVYVNALQRLRFWTYGLTRERQYDRALQLDRIWTFLPGYAPSLAGPILFNAGRYKEVQSLLAPKALDVHGQPRVDTLEFYTYVLALVNDGQKAEAERLLELALPSASQPESLQVALATCLLDQGKDPDRARILLEQAQATPKSPTMPAYEQRADDAKRQARYAWALASCGMRPNAEARIQEAIATSSGFKPDDLAGVEYFVGEAWRALGEKSKARETFDRALALNPANVTVLSIRKALAKLNV
jgi:tetratricopeptide (TPR) repeat protein